MTQALLVFKDWRKSQTRKWKQSGPSVSPIEAGETRRTGKPAPGILIPVTEMDGGSGDRFSCQRRWDEIEAGIIKKPMRGSFGKVLCLEFRYCDTISSTPISATKAFSTWFRTRLPASRILMSSGSCWATILPTCLSPGSDGLHHVLIYIFSIHLNSVRFKHCFQQFLSFNDKSEGRRCVL